MGLFLEGKRKITISIFFEKIYETLYFLYDMNFTMCLHSGTNSELTPVKPYLYKVHEIYWQGGTIGAILQDCYLEFQPIEHYPGIDYLKFDFAPLIFMVQTENNSSFK